MKKVARAIVDRTVVPLLAYLRYRVPADRRVLIERPGVVTLTWQRAVAESADYAEQCMPNALCFANIDEVWKYAYDSRALAGLIVEFGVWTGRSINYFASLAGRERVYGFDSFEGLQEDWRGWSFAKGHFSLAGEPPKVSPNVTLVKGWFDQTLPEFLTTHRDPFSFVHIDCDTYEGASTVFRLAADRFVPGTVVLFDEYFGYRGWKLGEFKAWQEFVQRQQMAYDYLAFSDQACLVKVTKVR